MSARYSRSGSISPRVVLHRNVQFDRNVDAIQPHIEKVSSLVSQKNSNPK